MLTEETFPRFLRRNTALDGGHHREGFSFGDFWLAGDVVPGKHHGERGVGCETTTVCRGLGEPVEALVTDEEVKVCCDNRVMAIYERSSGALTSVSFSLAQAFLEMSRYDIRTNQETVKLITQLIRGGDDLLVVIKFDKDGEARGAVVLSDSAGVCRPLAATKMTDRVPAEEGDGGEDKDELLQTWHCISQIGKIDFWVGIRVFVLDLVIINPYTGEGTPFHVAQGLDFSLLDREKITPQLVLELVADAFPGMDWV
ncbi:hypothetical protein HYU90_03355 [Candidatus Collierbacteria bacterium]|nr:hypothetical protein [Candidatus Collierbacteria bacterium]